MADVFSKANRSRIMAAVRSTGNKATELRLVSLLRENRIKGWRRQEKLPGKPDFVFKCEKVAVFVDGCFWHGCPRCYRLPQDNRASRELRSLGWRVLRIWEHTLKSAQGRLEILKRVTAALTN